MNETKEHLPILDNTKYQGSTVSNEQLDYAQDENKLVIDETNDNQSEHDQRDTADIEHKPMLDPIQYQRLEQILAGNNMTDSEVFNELKNHNPENNEIKELPDDTISIIKNLIKYQNEKLDYI